MKWELLKDDKNIVCLLDKVEHNILFCNTKNNKALKVIDIVVDRKKHSSINNTTSNTLEITINKKEYTFEYQVYYFKDDYVISIKNALRTIVLNQKIKKIETLRVPTLLINYHTDTIEYSNCYFQSLSKQFQERFYRNFKSHLEKGNPSLLERFNTTLYDGSPIMYDIMLDEVCPTRFTIVPLDGDISEYCYVFIEQINEENILMRRLKEESDIFRQITSLSNSAYFKISMRQKYIEFFGEEARKYGLKKMQINDRKSLIEMNIIHKEDIGYFVELVENIYHGIEDPISFRMNGLNEMSNWYQLEYKISHLDDGDIVAIGKAINIQEAKENEKKAKIDLLTGCFNKVTFENKVKTYLKDNTNDYGAFVIIDIDDFKSINDIYGHFYGDIVLKDVVKVLKNILNKSDYIGRIGGDEFAIFSKKRNNRLSIEMLAKQISTALNIEYSNEKKFTISTSIGISLCPVDGTTYKELYKKADIALYNTKRKGKNGNSFYNSSLENVSRRHTPIDSIAKNDAKYFDSKMLENVFSVLSNQSIESPVTKIFHDFQAYLNVDRCQLLRANKDFYEVDVEVTKKTILPRKDVVAYIHQDLFEDVIAKQSKNNSCVISGVTTNNQKTKQLLYLQDLDEVLYLFVYLGDKIKYIFTFGNVMTKGEWKEADIMTLIYSAKILGQYLLCLQNVTIGNQGKDNNEE